MSGASSVARKKRDRSARSPQPKKRPGGSGSTIHPLQRLTAAHEACRALLAGGTSAARSADARHGSTANLPGGHRRSSVGRRVPVAGRFAARRRPTHLGGLAQGPSCERASRGRGTVVEAPDDQLVTPGSNASSSYPVDAGANSAALLRLCQKSTFRRRRARHVRSARRLPRARDAPGERAGRAKRGGGPRFDRRSRLSSRARFAHPLTPISMLLQTLERKAASGAVDSTASDARAGRCSA